MPLRADLLAVAAAAALSLTTSAVAVAAPPCGMDRTYGVDGRAQHLGESWATPVAVAGDAAGGTVIGNDQSETVRLTAGGRADRGWGRNGVASVVTAYREAVGSAYSSALSLVPWGATTVAFMTYESFGTGPGAEPGIAVLDGAGRATAAGAALRRTLAPPKRSEVRRWIAARTRGELVDVVTVGSHTTLRRIGRDGGVRSATVVRWPRALGAQASVDRATWSGGALLALASRSVVKGPRLARLRPAGGLDRRFGRGGLARVPRDPVALLAWRGGAVVVGDRATWWYSRSGRVVARRAIRAGAAALDAQGRVLIARAGDDYQHISVVRLRRSDRRVDPAFGRVTLRAKGRSRPLALLPRPGGRVVVVAEALQYTIESDIREDYVALASRGTVAWRVRCAAGR